MTAAAPDPGDGPPPEAGPARAPGVPRRRAFAADLSPVRDNRAFRWLFVGQAVSSAGTQVTQVAVPLEVFSITHSSLDVGFVGLAALLPLVLLGLYGGAIADAVERKRLVTITSVSSGLVSATLMAQALAQVNALWLLYLCVAVQSACFAVDSPARRSILPLIVPAREIAAANTLFQAVFNLGLVVGPLLAGAFIGAFGFASPYAFDVASFGVALFAVRVGLPRLPPGRGVRRAGFASIVEGLRFLAPRKVLLMTFVVDIVAMVFGMPRALFPALAAGHFHGTATTASFLYSAPAVGAVVVAVTGGWMVNVRRQGLGVIVSVLGWGAAITVFGLSSSLWLGLLMLAVAGAADAVSAVFRSTMLQVSAPAEMQGRLSGVFIVVVAGGPRLGDIESGAVANAFGPIFSVVSGGLACIALTLLLVALVPRFAAYDAERPVM